MDAVKKGICEYHGEDTYRLIMQKVSSIVTDGCSMNTGHRTGLWIQFESEMQKEGADQSLLKFWCSAHRMELVWGDLTNNFKQIKKALDVLSSIASYFNQSGLRMEKLKAIAKANNVRFYSFAKLFEIRWTEWTFTTLINILKSWNALVVYFKDDSNARAVGFHKYLTNFKNIEFIVFLANVLRIYHRYQKAVQSDESTILTLTKSISTFKSALNKIIEEKLSGGWEEMFSTSIEARDEQIYLKNIELTRASTNRLSRNSDPNELRKSILETAIDLLDQRFKVEFDLVSIMEPFLSFNQNADIRKIHNIFGSELSLSSLTLQFNEITGSLTGSCDYFDLFKNISKNECSYKEYEELIKVIARIHVCSPQSADVERAVKANNLLKTVFRNRLSVETENKYLFVYMNMPALELWNPRPAIVSFIKEKERRQHSNLLDKETKKNAVLKALLKKQNTTKKKKKRMEPNQIKQYLFNVYIQFE